MDLRRIVTVGDVRDGRVTITLRMSRPLRFRIWLAFVLIRCAGWLIGAEVVEEDPTTEEE